MCLNQSFLREIMCLNHPCFAFFKNVFSAERSLLLKKREIMCLNQGDHVFKPGLIPLQLLIGRAIRLL